MSDEQISEEDRLAYAVGLLAREARAAGGVLGKGTLLTERDLAYCLWGADILAEHGLLGSGKTRYLRDEGGVPKAVGLDECIKDARKAGVLIGR